MAEPVSSTGITVALKVYGSVFILAVAALLAYLVVIMTRMPRSREEWVVSLITTVVGSIAGGSFIVQYFQLHFYVYNWFGALALSGIVFASGLPFWAITRWLFNYVNKNEESNLFEIIKEIKNGLNKDGE